MSQLIEATTEEQLRRFLDAAGAPGLDGATMAMQRADAHLMIEGPSGEIEARCSLWWTDPPPHTDHRLGLIGHYAARNDAAAGLLLDGASARLAAHGCTMAAGPMDGNTWNRYRLVTERGTEPPFFLEPDTHEDWPGQFTRAGFAPLAEYYSALSTDLARRDPRMTEVAVRLYALGVTIRPLRVDQFAGEMARIYDVSKISFQRNFLYTPISREDFLAMYEPIRPYVHPALVLLAEHEDRPVGFIFTLPDLNQARRGEPVDTLIIKTVAVLPEAGYAGLGSLLVARAHEIAEAAGFRRVIH
ncbi:MAG: N-acetyltransferase family protein, partial [Blastocatellia bacterium]